MEGPRAPHAHEMESLGRLVDAVFHSSRPGDMAYFFPTLFCEENRRRLVVAVDDGEVVCHVGLVERWASIAGCTLRVGLIGAVATYDSHRGRGLATELFQRACDNATADGCDFLMISGGRGLYRRAGAADVGLDYDCRITAAQAAELADGRVCAGPFAQSDVPFLVAAYGRKTAWYVRTSEDWRWFVERLVCMCRRSDCHIVRRDGATCGYLVGSADEKVVRIFEYAGEETALAAALPAAIAAAGAEEVHLHVELPDRVLLERLRAAGADLSPANTLGTMLLLNPMQLMARLRPAFEARLGERRADTLTLEIESDRFRFRLDDAELTVEGRMAAAEVIFGNYWRNVPAPFNEVFPLPPLWYGLSYV